MEMLLKVVQMVTFAVYAIGAEWVIYQVLLARARR